MRLRDRSPDAAPFARVFAANLYHFASNFYDAQQVLVGLCRQTQNEIQLHSVPAVRKHLLGCSQNLLFRDVLVDHVTQALRTRFGRECEASRAHLAELVEQIFTQSIGAQRCHPKANTLLCGSPS